MSNAIGTTGMYGAAEMALTSAVERAVAALGIGTVVALALVALVVAVEALARRMWGGRRESRGSRTRPAAPRGRGGAFR